MAIAVITRASGGLPVKDLGGPGGMAVTEVAPALGGIAVTKVTGTGAGMGVTFVSSTGGPVTPLFTTWNSADKSASINLTNGDLTVTNNSAVTAGVRAVSSYASGKYYFECTMTTWTNGGTGVGLAQASAPLNNQTGPIVLVVRTSRLIQINGAGAGASLGGTGTSGDLIGIAVDLTSATKLIWFRLGAAGNWDNNAAHNPATGAGGVNITAIAGTMKPMFLSGNVANEAATMNFGASAFVGAVPSGFTAGWPA